jgi:hypothetical protein
MVSELERGLELLFSKKLKQAITHPLVFSGCSFTSNICSPPICVSNDTKIAQFDYRMRKY